MNKTLKTLLDESAELENQLIEMAGELTPALEQSLMQIEINLPEKVTRYQNLIDRLEMEADNLYSKAKKYEMAANSLANLRQKLNENIKFQMIERGLHELKGADEIFTLTSGKKAVEITDLSKIPRSYIKQVISEQPDKEKIRVDLEAGVILNGANLRETKVLKRKVNKGN